MGRMIIRQATAGEQIAVDYCACACPLPTVEFLISTRSGSAGPSSGEAPDHYAAGIPIYKSGVYERASANLAGADYSAYAPGGGINGNFVSAPAIAHAHYEQSVLDPATGEQTITSGYNTSAEDKPNSLSSPTLTAWLAESKYKLRLTLANPIKGSQTFRVYWRECMILFLGEVIVEPDGSSTYSNSAEVGFEDKFEDVMFSDGVSTADSSIYDLSLPGLGTRMFLAGPSAVGKFINKVSTSGEDFTGMVVKTQRVDRVRNGFPAYVRERAHGDGDDGEPVVVYATETATTRAGSAVSYSGAQSIPLAKQIYDPGYGTPVPTFAFSSSVPHDYISRIDGTGGTNYFSQDLLATQSDAISPTEVQFKNGLILTLSDPIDADSLAANCQTALDALPFGGGSQVYGMDEGIFAIRRATNDALSITLSKCQRAMYFDCEVLSGIWGVPQPFGNAYKQDLLATASGTLDIAFDTFAVDLATGIKSSTAPITGTATFDFGGSRPLGTSDNTASVSETARGDVHLDGQPVLVSMPPPTEANTLTGYQHFRVTTEELQRILLPPQVEVMDSDD